MKKVARTGHRVVKSCACGRAYTKREWDVADRAAATRLNVELVEAASGAGEA